MTEIPNPFRHLESLIVFDKDGWGKKLKPLKKIFSKKIAKKLFVKKFDLKSLLIDESGTEPPENSFCGIKADGLEAGISKINIVDQSHNPLLVKVFNSHSLIPHDFIAVVLISHGSKGEGAYTSAGTRNPIKHEGIDKAENANNDFLFVDRQKSVDFDDTVSWVTRNNLMATYVQKPCRTK